jgi:hypothetical protein
VKLWCLGEMAKAHVQHRFAGKIICVMCCRRVANRLQVQEASYWSSFDGKGRERR